MSVMHPLDVLQGRLDNLYGLTAKQDEHGLAQLELAIAMTRDFLRSIGPQEAALPGRASRPVVLRHLARIEALALSDAGRKVAQRHIRAFRRDQFFLVDRARRRHAGVLPKREDEELQKARRHWQARHEPGARQAATLPEP